MRKFLYLAFVWAGLFATPALAADAHRSYNRPTLSFTPSSFTVSYGTTTNVCVTVTPARKASVFTNPSVWQNSIPGAFSITPGTNPSCTGSGKVFLSILSRINDVCVANANVLGVLNQKPAGTAVGSVLLPSQEVAKLKANSSSQGVIDAEWRITFTDASGTADFNGLEPVGERLFISPGDPNDCAMGTGPDFETTDWVLGPVTAGGNTRGNSLVDLTSKFVSSNQTCTSIVSQRFLIGQCTIPAGTPIKITFQFTSGAPLLTRSDGEP